MDMSNTECPRCGHVFKDHDNLYGKICIYCGEEIKTNFTLPIIKENKEKNDLLILKVLDSVRRKFLPKK